jgi:hypothetical protein
LREDILRFYSIPSAPIETKKDPANWQNVLRDLRGCFINRFGLKTDTF